LKDCLFCSIISKREAAHILYEDDYVCCFLDKYPICKGHTLVVPKNHYVEFSDVDEESLSKVIQSAQRLAQALESLLNTDGITIMQNNGLFKSVDHYHMHVIPRFEGDGFSWIEPKNIVTEEEFIALSRNVKNIINN